MALAAALLAVLVGGGQAHADDGLTPAEAQFLNALAATGFHWTGSPSSMVKVGQDVCADLTGGASVDQEAGLMNYAFGGSRTDSSQLGSAYTFVRMSITYLCPFAAGGR